MKSALYYEAHITIEPVFDEELEHLKTIVAKHSFRVAELLMKKRKEDLPEHSSFDTFCTARCKDFDLIKARTMECVTELQVLGFKVWRYKIEDTLLDVRLPH